MSMACLLGKCDYSFGRQFPKFQIAKKRAFNIYSLLICLVRPLYLGAKKSCWISLIIGKLPAFTQKLKKLKRTPKKYLVYTLANNGSINSTLDAV